MCAVICDGACAGICDGVPSTCSWWYLKHLSKIIVNITVISFSNIISDIHY